MDPKRSSRYSGKQLGPAAAAMRRNSRSVFRDGRESQNQVTMNKLIEDAVEMQKFHAPTKTGSTKVMIYSPEELALYRQKRRSELEVKVRRGYAFLGNWVKYARWEAQQKDYVRMRSVLQRAVAVHGDNPNLWRDYAELEAANGFVDEARQVWSRGVTSLPAASDLWMKYLVLEQTAGQDGAVRDVFNRWLSLPTPPSCAYELYALFEAQRGNQDACRAVLKRYVEDINTCNAWLLYSTTEWRVFGDAARGVKVLRTALEALPDAVLWGPEDCRIPLAIAEVLVQDGKVDEARQAFHDLLGRLQDSDSHELVDRVLSDYSRFERLHGDRKDYEHISRLEARRVYERRIEQKPEDFDARLSLYLLLREPVSASPQQQEIDGSNKHKVESMQCLEAAVAVPASSPASAQQRAVLVMELARRYDDAGRTDEARALLASGLKTFPFDHATCPRLWLEAAAFEHRHGDCESARKILSAAAHVTNDPRIFAALLKLEEDAMRAGAQAHDEYLNRTRRVYQNAIKAFAHSERWWFDFAKLEEKQDQVARAMALYDACIKTFTSSASRTTSFAERYALLGKVDQAWARRLALQRRRLKRLAAGTAEAGALEQGLRDLYGALLQGVWQDYVFEAVAWRTGNMEERSGADEEATAGRIHAPHALPDVLVHATTRWSQAVSVAVDYALSCPEGGIAYMRSVFTSMVEKERGVLQRTLGLTDGTGYDDAQCLKGWVELLLSPLVQEWSRFEAVHGGSLEKVQEVVSVPTKRRTRLFKKK